MNIKKEEKEEEEEKKKQKKRKKQNKTKQTRIEIKISAKWMSLFSLSSQKPVKTP